MKLVTADYKNAIVQPRRIDAKIIKDDTTITIDNINNITRSFNSSLFKSIMKTLTLDTNNSFNVGIVNPQIGIYTNEKFEYISLEKFKLIKTERNQDTLSYESKCYDKIIESMIDFDLDVTYPIKVRDYWIAIYNKLGWNISGIPEAFINSEKYIKKDVHSKIGYTYRDVIDELCTISCAFLVDKNGIPTISYPYDTNEIIDEEYMEDVSVKIGNKIFFNSLVFSRAEGSDNIFRKDEKSISTHGLKEFKVSDNQLLSTNDREDYIDEMWEYIKNFEYYSFDIKTRGITFLDPIDKFSIKIGTNVYPTILLNDDLQICDGIFETIYNDEIKETTTEYKYAAETDKRINQAYMMVDKQKGIITATVETQKEQSSTLDNLIKKNQSESYIEISDAFEGNPIYFSFYGNIHYLYPGANIYPGANTFTRDSYLSIEYENSSTKMRLPYFDLNYTENLYDEFVIDGTKAYIIRRLSGDLQPLENEIIEELGNVSIPLKNGYNKLKMESFNLNYYIKYNVQNNYTNSFATKAELKITEDAIEGEVSKKADDKEIKGLISTIAGEIDLKVEKKVDNSEYTHAEIVAKINDDTSEVLIDADKVNITANDVLNLIAGNELNLTSKNMTIVSDNFNVDKYGNVKIQDEGQAGNTNLTIISNENQTYQLKNLIRSDGIFMSNGNQTLPDSLIYMSTVGTGRPQISLSYYKNNSDENLLLSSSYIVLRDGTSETTISPSGIKTPTLTQTSLANSKKNFEKLENALEIISNTDIYKYHLKSQNDDDKKHIGFVIGNKFNYSKDITSEKNDGVDIYSMVSVCLQAIKELNNKIKILEEKICQ